MTLHSFEERETQLEGVSCLMAFKREDGEDELYPLDIPAEGTGILMKDGSRLMIFRIPGTGKKKPKHS
ncbi:MAG: hypothetical protein V2A78_09645 [bacterium]